MALSADCKLTDERTNYPSGTPRVCPETVLANGTRHHCEERIPSDAQRRPDGTWHLGQHRCHHGWGWSQFKSEPR